MALDKKSPRLQTLVRQCLRPLVHTKFPSLSTRCVENPHVRADITFGCVAWSTARCCFRLSLHPFTDIGARCDAPPLSGNNFMTPRTYWLVVTIFVVGLLLAFVSRYVAARPPKLVGTGAARECSTQALLNAMREQLRPEVDSSESQGIYLAAADPTDEDALAAYAVLGRICRESPGRRASGGATLAERLAHAASGFIMQGKLEPGRYVLTGAMGGSGGDGVVTVSSEHLALLRSMNTRTQGRAVMLMDSKRPYGDMSHFYIDMARALREPVPLDASGRASFAPEVIARYDELHGQMPAVVHVFWSVAEPIPASS